MHSVILAVILQLLGVIAIVAEFVIPSAGLLTVAAIAAFGFSLYTLWVDVSSAAAITVGLCDVVLIPLCVWAGVRLLARTPAALTLELSSKTGSVSQDLSLVQLVGAAGEVISDLRPSGRAMIAGRKYDVVTAGDYLEKGAGIRVTEVNGNRIVVKKETAENVSKGE